MATIRVRDGQNMADIALQYYGNVEAMIQIALDNDLSITDELVGGQELVITNEQVTEEQLTDFYTKNEVIINTGYTTDFRLLGDFNRDFGTAFF